MVKKRKITGFVPDQHSSAAELLDRSGQKLADHLDRNHVMSSWEKCFQAHRWIQVIRSRWVQHQENKPDV
jgi:hypothetical protein